MSITVTVDKIHPTPSGLRCGSVIRYGADGPVRFVEVFLPYAAFDKDTRAALLVAFDKAVDAWMDAEPADTPLF